MLNWRHLYWLGKDAGLGPIYNSNNADFLHLPHYHPHPSASSASCLCVVRELGFDISGVLLWRVNQLRCLLRSSTACCPCTCNIIFSAWDRGRVIGTLPLCAPPPAEKTSRPGDQGLLKVCLASFLSDPWHKAYFIVAEIELYDLTCTYFSPNLLLWHHK